LKKQETQKKIIKKLKLSHKNEKETSISSKRKKIFKPYNWNEVKKKISIQFWFSNEFQLRLLAMP
jgi:hypothetical protein